MSRSVLCAVLTGALFLGGCVGYREGQALEALENGQVDRAFKLTRALARRGQADAQFHVGLMFTNGQGVRKSEAQGMEWLRKAALQGHKAARAKVASVYIDGGAPTPIDDDILSWMRESAEQGTADSRYKLGSLYLTGTLLEKDPAEGLRFLALAAENWPQVGRPLENRLRDDGLLPVAAELGLKEAQYGMAQSFGVGADVPMSKSESAKWYFLAATRGHASAQNALGWIYSNGSGVSIDHAEAARWFTKAAEQGHVEAQYQLGMMFERGFGVPLDAIQAHMWFNLASSKGHQKAREKRELMVKRLSPSGLTQAEELAVEWWKSRLDLPTDAVEEPAE